MTSMEDASSPPIKRKKYDEISLRGLTEDTLANLLGKLHEERNLNYAERLQIHFDPKSNSSTQTSKDISPHEIPHIYRNYIFIEVSSHMWFEALELSFVFITHKQYLPGTVLKAIVEIMLHAHNDISSKYTMDTIINKCQQVLALHFTMHPPDPHRNISTYKDLLIEKEHNTTEKQKNKNIIEYCFERLEEDINFDSEDGPMKNIKELQDTGDSLRYKIETRHELLDRNNRIDRIMAVLESLIELLQINLLLWVQNITMRERVEVKEPLMSLLLYPDEKRKQLKHSELCKQIVNLFVKFIHLDYPEHYIRIMSVWLNVVIETYIYKFYDYEQPLYRKPVFVAEFYNIMTDFSYESMNKILERIKPSYMKLMIGITYCQTLLKRKENGNEKIFAFINYYLESEQNDFDWNHFSNIELLETDPKKLLDHLASICLSAPNSTSDVKDYPKFEERTYEMEPSPNIIRNALYITLEAYFDSLNFFKIKELEKPMLVKKSCDIELVNIYQKLKELIIHLKDLKKKYGPIPKKLKVFEYILSLEEKQ